MRTGDISILSNLISVHYITIFLAVLFGIKLLAQKTARDVDLRFYWLTLVCCFLLVIEDVLETYCALDPERRFWRTLLSVAGYILRPTAGVSLLLVVCPPEKRTWKLWIPWAVSAAVNLTAFFSPVAFSFDEDYDFVRGPLGFVVFAISFLYMLIVLHVVWKRFYEGKKAERWVLIICVIGCMGSSFVDAFYGRVHLNEALMIACVFMYMYLRSHDNYLDQLTSLRNRFAFYDDAENRSGDISAVASIDMNGLKRLNDTKGHAEGDRALTAIGSCMAAISSRNIIPYRVGGDEFNILFISRDEETVRKTLQTLRESVAASGYSISAGYTMSSGGQSLDELLRESDRNMYENKAEYYRQSGKDRRSRPRTGPETPAGSRSPEPGQAG